MRVLAPAKINLHLRVGGRDASGFHALLSWFTTVGLSDELEFRATAEPRIKLSCDDPSIPADSSNLVLKAANALRKVCPDASGADITLQKRIPPGGGLGGGSSDAARTLLALNVLWKLNLRLERLHEIAAGIGSDVPFFLHGSSSICTGRGEIVQPTAAPRLAKWALLFLSDLALPTAMVYRKFDDLSQPNALLSEHPPWHEWADLPAEQLLPGLVNDLEPAAFALMPQLHEMRISLERLLRRVIRMTGSGSTLFTLLDDRHEAERAAQIVRSKLSCQALVTEVAPSIHDDLPAEKHGSAV
jgi:4-diphosphocytidyl-2-C-methyl-D-erythritol kinase